MSKPLNPPAASIAWQQLAYMHHVVWTRPDIAFAVRRLSLRDQLELTLELLADCMELASEVPPNVVRFRPRRGSQTTRT